MAEEMLVQQAETQKNKYVIFAIDKEDFAIPIYYINDIQSDLTIAQVPSVPDYVKGIASIRGTVIPVVDVRIRFRKTPIPYNDRTCIVVIDYDGLMVGLVVDMVKAVLEIPESNVLAPPNAKVGYFNRYVKNVGKVGDTVKLILDLEKLIKEDYEI